MRCLVFMTVATLGACSDTPPASHPKPVDAVAGYQRCWEHYHAGAWDALRDCYADHASSMRLGLPTQTGAAAIVASHRVWRDAFPDAKVTSHVVIADGSEVVSMRWFAGTHTATLRGPTGDIPATGKRVGLAMLHHMTLDIRGRATAETIVFDLPTLMFQLGLSPGPARVARDGTNDPRIVVGSRNTSERANVAAVRRAYALFNARDPAFGAFLADNIVESNNSEPEDTVAKRALEQHNAALIGAFSTIRVDLERVLAAGPYTVGFAHMRGTHDGDLGPLKRTGKSIDVPLVEVIEWRDGKAVRSWPFLNGMQLAAQLGLM